MAASTTVQTVFRARDLVSGTLKKMQKNSTLFGSKTDRAFKRASRSALGFKSVLGGILGAGLIQRGLFAMREGVGAVTREFVDLDDAITSASAKFPEGIERGTLAFRDLEMAARDIGAATKFTASEAGRGLEFLAMAGFNAEQSMAALPKTTQLAEAANMDMARATDIASDALGAFNLNTKNSAQLTENLGRINDVFAKTVTTANVDLEQMFETMKMAGPVATAAGQSIETFAAATGVMGSSGIKGSLAGTALRTAFLNLSAPVPKAAKLLKKLKIETKDSAGNMLDFFEILQDVRNGTEKMGTAQRAAALNTIFGKRAIAGMTVLLDKGGEALWDYRKTLEASGGAAEKMAERMRKSLGNRLLQLKSAAIELGLKVFDAFKKKFPGGIDAAIEAVRKFDVSKIIEGIKTMVKFTNMAIEAIKVLKPLIKAYVIYKGAIIAVTAVQWLFNAAAAANPIGALILSIMALVFAVKDLRDNWGDTARKLKLIWVDLKLGFFEFSTSVLKDINNLIEGANNLLPSFAQIPKISENIIKGAEAVQKALKAEKAGLLVEGGTEFVKKQLAAGKISKDQASRQLANIVQNLARTEGLSESTLQKVLKAKSKTDELAQSAIGALKGRATQKELLAEGAPGFRRKDVSTEIRDPVEELIGAFHAQQGQSIDFQGRIDIAGAPEGTTVESTTRGAPPIDMSLGANP
jgi:TP901 family phage tail tape measure protein